MNPSAITERERTSPHDHEWSSRTDVGRGTSAVIGRIEREHATIRALLEQVERALGATETDADVGLQRLRSAVWDLRLAFVAHLDFEEAELAPLWQRSGEAMAAIAMVLDHNEQRRILCELVEDLESEVLELDALWARTTVLVLALRRDVAAEDRVLHMTWS